MHHEQQDYHDRIKEITDSRLLTICRNVNNIVSLVCTIFRFAVDTTMIPKVRICVNVRKHGLHRMHALQRLAHTRPKSNTNSFELRGPPAPQSGRPKTRAPKPLTRKPQTETVRPGVKQPPTFQTLKMKRFTPDIPKSPLQSSDNDYPPPSE